MTAAAPSPLMCTLASGGGAPLFVVPSVGTTPMSLVRLARAIEPRRTVHAFAYGGFEDDREPFGSIEAMAKACVAEIVAAAPDGPWLLGGHCLGGTVALEIAQQLGARGGRVACLALMDAIAPILADDRLVLDDATVAAIHAREPHVREVLEGVGRRTLESFASLGPEVYTRLLTVVTLYVDHSVAYRARRCAAPIALISTVAPDDPDLARWTHIGGRPPTQHAAGGDTMSMLRPPHVEGLGRTLGAALAQAA
jgi:thioesterase domain-containing protein